MPELNFKPNYHDNNLATPDVGLSTQSLVHFATYSDHELHLGTGHVTDIRCEWPQFAFVFKEIVPPKMKLYSLSGHPKCRLSLFVFSLEQILRNLASYHLLTSGSSYSEWVPSEWESQNITIIHKYLQSSINILWSKSCVLVRNKCKDVFNFKLFVSAKIRVIY